MRRRIEIGLCLGFAFLGVLAAPAWAQGPIGYWKGDETPPPPGNTAVSFTGAHNGTYTNGATTVQPRPGTAPAFRFNNPGCMTFAGGDSPNAQYVSIPDDPALQLTGNFAVSLWMRKSSEAADWTRLVGKGLSGTRQFGVWEEPGGDRILFQQWGTTNVDIFSTTVTVAGNWYHIVAQVTGAGNGTAELWINGSREAMLARGGPPATSTDPLTIGAWTDTFHTGLNGQIDDVRLYNRALTQPEISLLYQGYTDVTAPALSGTAGIMQIQLDWTPNPDPNVQSYTLERATAAGGPWTAVTPPGYTQNTILDTNVQPYPPTEYWYRVTAVGLGTATSTVFGPLHAQPVPPRTNDHEEGFVDGNCGCGSVRPGAALWALALAGMVLAFGLARR